VVGAKNRTHAELLLELLQLLHIHTVQVELLGLRHFQRESSMVAKSERTRNVKIVNRSLGHVASHWTPKEPP
jgi:hypothetical protein